MVKKETKVVTEEVETVNWSLSNSDKKELIAIMPKLLGYAIAEAYDSISDLFDTLDNAEQINCIYNLGVKFMDEEIEYIDSYNDNGDYLGYQIIDFILDYEKNNHIEPDFTELLENDYRFCDFLENKGIDAIVKYFDEKPELKKDLLDFLYND